MSERNGDKARFQRERHRRILRRQRARELRKALGPADLAHAASMKEKTAPSRFGTQWRMRMISPKGPRKDAA